MKENGERVFVDSPPEFCPPLDKLIDFSQLDVILISNYLCMMALPFITEGTGFQGRVYATEPTLQIGRYFFKHQFSCIYYLLILKAFAGRVSDIHRAVS